MQLRWYEKILCTVFGTSGTTGLVYVVNSLCTGRAEWTDLLLAWAAGCLLGVAIPLAYRRL